MKQRGAALIEAVVAAGLLGAGLLGAMRLLLHALDAARQNRDQELAQTLAREALDCAIARHVPCAPADTFTRQGIQYSVQLQTLPQGPHLTTIVVQVDWSAGSAPTSVRRRMIWQTRVSDLPDGLGVSSPDG
jgi:Tfp pilus assembly protein PilV